MASYILKTSLDSLGFEFEPPFPRISGSLLEVDGQVLHPRVHGDPDLDSRARFELFQLAGRGPVVHDELIPAVEVDVVKDQPNPLVGCNK